MPKSATYEEQWSDRLSADTPLYRVSVRPLVPGRWRLHPRNLDFEPRLVYWAMCPMPDGRHKDGLSYRTVWIAFRESPELSDDPLSREGEAIIVNYEPMLSDVLVPGFRFNGTINGRTPVVEVTILG